LIAKLNSLPWVREFYYKIGKEYLDLIVGNELSMQLRINLSIQFPNDDSSLLPLHCDTWSGDSPFEVVLWVPLVDCYDTKSMYLLSPEESKKLYESFNDYMGLDSEVLYRKLNKKIKFLSVKYGQLLIFNQGIPHGNRINETSDTRWSMNCRFKNVFSPYGDKKLGEFFEPINLKAASKIGMDYFNPKIKK
jgi:sporadic carbohydrate cluster 2OG-Fe(II) oxygenase